MGMNVRLIRVPQFIRGFCLSGRHKSEKDHIVPDVLSKLECTNTNLPQDSHHLQLDVLSVCIATLVQLSSSLFRKIIPFYMIDEWWKKILTQIDNNDRFLENKAIFLFERRDGLAASADSYFSSRHKLDPLKPVSGLGLDTSLHTEVNSIDYTLLLFNVNYVTWVCRLCIPLVMAKDIIEIEHGQGHPGFARSYEIVSRSWYIGDLKRLLRCYIYHCP